MSRTQSERKREDSTLKKDSAFPDDNGASEHEWAILETGSYASQRPALFVGKCVLG